MNAPRPGPDEITVAAPKHGDSCNSRGHRDTGRAADVLATFGSCPTRDAFWPETWGRAYPFCRDCWTLTLAALGKARPHLAVRDGEAA